MTALAHDAAFAALPELALDALDGEERHAVLVHVRDCIACRRELDVLREATAALGESIAAVPLHASKGEPMKERLVARAGSERGVVVPLAPSERPPVKGRWMAAAGLMLLASMGGMAWALRGRADALAQNEAASARYAMTARALDDRNRQLEERTAMIAALTGPGVAVVNLAASGSRDPVARMFWDRATNRWTMVGHNLPRPKPGRTYQLWLVTATEKISAGTFTPTEGGDALVQATYALPADALKAIAVTDEPAAGVPQPTGPIVISGAAS